MSTDGEQVRADSGDNGALVTGSGWPGGGPAGTPFGAPAGAPPGYGTGGPPPTPPGTATGAPPGTPSGAPTGESKVPPRVGWPAVVAVAALIGALVGAGAGRLVGNDRKSQSPTVVRQIIVPST